MSSNGLAHSKYIATCLQWKTVLHKADLQETKIVPYRHDISKLSDSTISTYHSIRYEIIEKIISNHTTLYKALQIMRFQNL